MRNFYYVTVKKNDKEQYRAEVLAVADNQNLLYWVDDDVKIVHQAGTKKNAKEIAEDWNSVWKKEGHYWNY